MILQETRFHDWYECDNCIHYLGATEPYACGIKRPEAQWGYGCSFGERAYPQHYVALLSCPCGAPPLIEKLPREEEVWSIKCSSPDCPLYREPIEDESIQHLRNVWNERIKYDDRHHKVLSKMLGAINRKLAKILELGGGER